MIELKTSKKGLPYLDINLKKTKNTFTKAIFWQITHNSGVVEVSLKIGKYKTTLVSFIAEPICKDPKSEVTLSQEELDALINCIEEHYHPIKQGVKKYLAVGDDFDEELAGKLKAIFSSPDQKVLLDFIVNNNLLPQNIFLAIQIDKRRNAIKQFEGMISNKLSESNWQKWFRDNDWVLGSEFVRVLDDRVIDTKHISDYLMQAYDGFLDIIEIKKPSKEVKFWHPVKDHENYIPSSDLTKAIIQSSKYIYEVEREANSVKFLERVGAVKTIKPRCVLIFGRSNDWNDEQKEAYRILNSSFHNLTVLTYDHVLSRARRILQIEK